MANGTITSDITYAGNEAGTIIGEAFMNDKYSLGMNIFTERQGVKGKTVLRVISVGQAALQGTLCDFTPLGGNINTKELPLLTHNVNLQFCKDDLNVDWTAFDMEAGVDGSFTGESANTIIETILVMVGEAVDAEIWTLIKAEAAADGDVVPVALTATTLTNIIGEVSKMYTALAATPGFNPNEAFIAMSLADKALYAQAVAAQGAVNTTFIGNLGDEYIGVRLVGVIGIVKGDMYASVKSNMFFASDLVGDTANVGVKDMNEHDFSNNIRFKAHWAQGASYAKGEDFVLGATA